MPIDYSQTSEGFLWSLDRYASSHRSIDPRQHSNGDRRVSVRVTQTQYEQIVECAKSLRLTLAEYVRLKLEVSEVATTSEDYFRGLAKSFSDNSG